MRKPTAACGNADGTKKEVSRYPTAKPELPWGLNPIKLVCGSYCIITMNITEMTVSINRLKP